jgi:hypothetical protein
VTRQNSRPPKEKKNKRRYDPRTSDIRPKAGPVTIRRADGTTERQPAKPGTKYATQPINIHMRRYQNLTPQGLNFYLSLSDIGVCCIIVYDVFTAEAQMRYFTNVTQALRFINNL